MPDPITLGSIAKVAGKPAFELVSTGAVSGWRKVRNYFFSPTILIAGQHNAGKSTLSEYFQTGKLPPKEESKDETQDFEDCLVEIEAKRGAPATFWIRDSRGYCDTNPLAMDIEHVRPVFIFFVFDIKKINEKIDDSAAPTETDTKYEFVKEWTGKFLQRVKQHVKQGSKAHKRMCGAAVLINKCDRVDEATFKSRKEVFDKHIKRIFLEFQPLLNFGDQRFEVYYTAMMEGRTLPLMVEQPADESGKALPRKRKDSEFPLAIDFMVRMLRTGKVIK
jgi:hypothetical protein